MMYAGNYVERSGKLVAVYKDDDGKFWAKAPGLGANWMLPGGPGKFKPVIEEIIGRDLHKEALQEASRPGSDWTDKVYLDRVEELKALLGTANTTPSQEESIC